MLPQGLLVPPLNPSSISGCGMSSFFCISSLESNITAGNQYSEAERGPELISEAAQVQKACLSC